MGREIDGNDRFDTGGVLPRGDLHGRIGMVARFKPVHNGHAGILKAAQNRASEFIIGIGSAGEWDVRNPFTAGETEDMLRLLLAGTGNCRILSVPDLHDGPRWRDLVASLFGKLDYFISANNYVRSLLAKTFSVVHPLQFLKEEDLTPVSGTMVRMVMAKGGNWRALVPAEVADYITKNGLDERFRREFGLATLSLLADGGSA